jgi:hypothetical protein
MLASHWPELSCRTGQDMTDRVIGTAVWANNTRERIGIGGLEGWARGFYLEGTSAKAGNARLIVSGSFGWSRS